MRTCCGIICVFFVIYLSNAWAQLPPRPLHIPGAVLLQGARPVPLRPQRIGGAEPQRPRRPNYPNALPQAPQREIRPVVEEEEDFPAPTTNFDDEVNKLGISALNSAVRQAEEAEEPAFRPSPLPFRPEKPIPVTRDQIRESQQRPVPALRPLPAPAPRPLPAQSAPRPIQRQERPLVRQELDDEEENIPRQPVRKTRPQQPVQQYRPAPAQRPAPRPQVDDEEPRKRKPVSQILRKYRNDNPDGSITWGFENDDGTFKEETLGIDCVTRGKYGYVDPDGVRREYSYESGNKCDEPDEDELEDLPPRPQPKKPSNIGKPQPQYRPQPGPQYQN